MRLLLWGRVASFDFPNPSENICCWGSGQGTAFTLVPGRKLLVRMSGNNSLSNHEGKFICYDWNTLSNLSNFSPLHTCRGSTPVSLAGVGGFKHSSELTCLRWGSGGSNYARHYVKVVSHLFLQNSTKSILLTVQHNGSSQLLSLSTFRVGNSGVVLGFFVLFFCK